MEWRPSSPEACALVETLAVEAWRFRYIDRLMELAFRDPDPKVVVAKVFTLVRHWADAASHFYRALHRLDALATEPIQKISTSEPNCRQHPLITTNYGRNIEPIPHPRTPRMGAAAPNRIFHAHRCGAVPPRGPYSVAKCARCTESDWQTRLKANFTHSTCLPVS